MLNISQLLAQELSPKPVQVKNALEPLSRGATVPSLPAPQGNWGDEWNPTARLVWPIYLPERTRRTQVSNSKCGTRRLPMSWRSKSQTATKPNLKTSTFPTDQKTDTGKRQRKGLERWRSSSSRWTVPMQLVFLNEEASKHISSGKTVTVEEALKSHLSWRSIREGSVACTCETT